MHSQLSSIAFRAEPVIVEMDYNIALWLDTGRERRLHVALGKIASHCDGAHRLDAQGFNKFDAEKGKALAAKWPEEWTGQDTKEAERLVQKYRKQLGSTLDELLQGRS